MGVEQRSGAGSNPRISRVVSKPVRDQGTATTDNRTQGRRKEFFKGGGGSF